MNRTAALLIAPAVLATTALGTTLASPAAATHDGWHTKTCWLTTQDTTLYVRLRFANDDIRIRVSHPDGIRRFHNNRVISTRAVYTHDGAGFGSKVFRGSRPVYTTTGWPIRGKHTATVRFTLDNGVAKTVTCSERFR